MWSILLLNSAFQLFLIYIQVIKYLLQQKASILSCPNSVSFRLMKKWNNRLLRFLFLFIWTYNVIAKKQMGLCHLTRSIYKNIFAWTSDNLLFDSLLNKEEQHYNNSWQMLFPLTLKFLKPFQKHMQKLICLSVDFRFQAVMF